MLSSCLKLLLGLSFFVINTKCMPTDANEDDKIDETDGHNEKGDIKTDAHNYQKDGENDVDENDEPVPHQCRARHCTESWVANLFQNYACIKTRG